MAITISPPMAVYLRPNGTAYHVRDSLGHHWTVQHDGMGCSKLKYHSVSHAKYYGRIDFDPEAPRNRTPALDVLVSKWSAARDKKRTYAFVQHSNKKLRTHTAQMNSEMRDWGLLDGYGHPLSATRYATHFNVRKHDGLNYEWCHLVAHGLGGQDSPENLFLGSKPHNSEQLIIESAVYNYKIEAGLFVVDVTAGLPNKKFSAKGFIADVVQYRVQNSRNDDIFIHLMDPHRITTPNADIENKLYADVVHALNWSVEYEYGKVNKVPNKLKEEIAAYVVENG
jgi:hypothetical protein